MAIQKHRVVSAVYKNVRRYGGEVKNLPRNDAYTLHKSARVRFRRRKTYSKGLGDLFQIDLVDLGNISSHNDGYRYLLTCLDVFSKRALAVATKTKTGGEVSQALEKILADPIWCIATKARNF